MKYNTVFAMIGLTLASCTTKETVIIYDSTTRAGTASTSKPAPSQPKVSGPIGRWSGTSRGEAIIVNVGSNGSLILTNDAGSNSGSWSSSGPGSYRVNISGQPGNLVLLNPTTASLSIGGSSIQLHK